jgi:hypothetical protein
MNPCRCFFERFNERLRGEGLCKKCDASRVQRSITNGRVPVPGHENNRYGNSIRPETMPELDARSIIQVDVENDADRTFKIGVVLKSLCR